MQNKPRMSQQQPELPLNFLVEAQWCETESPDEWKPALALQSKGWLLLRNLGFLGLRWYYGGRSYAL